MRFILGSASPRRLELLAQLGIRPDSIQAADVDETPHSGERPLAYCVRVALAKSAAISRLPGELVLTADTTVAIGRRILGKPNDEKEAAEFLVSLSGRRHKVITAITVSSDQGVLQRHVTTAVQMKRLSDEELNFYLACDDWRGKAGAYAIQGPAAAFIPWIKGSYSAVMGLPLAETATLLQASGLPVARGWAK
ncbi:MAG: septum formation protein Maf [Boseongicola sp.]|nr:MAG: septum formation protein Maf [Boseongicola sp.]